MNDEQKMQEVFQKILDEKLSSFTAGEIEAAVAKELAKQKAAGTFNDRDMTRSVFNTDPATRKLAPFIHLSAKMEKFCKAIATKTALNSETDDDGGVLVPGEMEMEIIRYMSESSIVRPRARLFTTSGDSKILPALDQSSDQFAGIALYWLGQSDEAQESEPKFSRIKLVLNKILGYTLITDELKDDSMVNIANFVTNLFREAIGYAEDGKFINGSGTNQPMGILNSPLTSGIARATAGQVNVADFYNLDNEIPEHLQDGLVWLMRKTTKNSLRGKRAQVYNGSTVVETGNFLLQEDYSKGGMPNILGYPVIISEQIPALGSKGDVILANLKGYGILDKRSGGITVSTSEHVRFKYDETAIKLVKRVDGQVIQRKAFAMLNA